MAQIWVTSHRKDAKKYKSATEKLYRYSRDELPIGQHQFDGIVLNFGKNCTLHPTQNIDLKNPYLFIKLFMHNKFDPL